MRIIIIAPMLLAACAPIDRGKCLAGHQEPARTHLQPTRIGTVTTLLTVRKKAHFECDRWEFPEGRK